MSKWSIVELRPSKSQAVERKMFDGQDQIGEDEAQVEEFFLSDQVGVALAQKTP